MEKFEERYKRTLKLMKELHTMKFDYGKCIKKSIEVIDAFLGDAGHSGFSAACTLNALVNKYKC